MGDVYVALSNGRPVNDTSGNPGQPSKWHDWFAINSTEQVRVGDKNDDGKEDKTEGGPTAQQININISF